jgi:hypothetical protein
MKHPTRQPKLLNLRSFTVSYHRDHVQLRNEVIELCKWVRRAIAGSAIEELKFIPENDSDISGRPSSCFTGLFDHIVKKQSSTIRILDLGSAFVCVDHLRSLLISCVRLEELKLSVNRNALASPFFIFFADKSFSLSICFDRASLPFTVRAWYGFIRHHFTYATSSAAFKLVTQ